MNKIRNLTYEVEKCECGHTAPIEFAYHDDDGNWTCYKCIIDELSFKLKKHENSTEEASKNFSLSGVSGNEVAIAFAEWMDKNRDKYPGCVSYQQYFNEFKKAKANDR